MEGKRVAQPEGGQRKKTRAAGIVAAVLVGLILGLCFYANSYTGVFPGVTVEDIPVDAGCIYLAGDEQGEPLGTYTLETLGLYVVPGEADEAAYAVGREPGVLGWFKNGWTMARGLLGSETRLQRSVYYDEAVVADFVGDLAAGFDRAPTDGSYELTREGLFATKEVNGRALDQAALAKDLMGAGGGEVFAQWEAVPGKPLDLPALAQKLNAPASPARYDTESGQVVDGQVGVRMDPEAARLVLDAVAEGERVLLPADITFPEMTARELEAVLFRDLLGTNTTKVSGSAARKGNVQLAAAAVSGLVLNDGDIFDYNAVVGERTVERGYGEAATYVNGETVNTVGGGICQVSSTIYLSALLSDLEIVERYAHRYWPGYIDYGMDATVSWGGPEFQFKNNTGYPIRIEAAYENSKLTVNIYGTKTGDTYVKMSREILSSTGYETEYVETEDLPWGTQKEKQNGYTGYEVKSYRNIYDGDGKLISSTLEAESSYKNRNKIILVGVEGRPEVDLPPSTGEGEPTLPPEEGGAEPTLPPEEGGEETGAPG